MRFFTRSFLAFLFLLLASEFLMRFVLVSTMEGRFDYGYHPTAGFDEKSDGTVKLQRSGGRRFFPQSFVKERPQNVYRVMVVGDSVARGTSVQESYAGQLQKQLRELGIQAECLNLGLPGFGARRKDLVIQQVLKYQPNLVILHLGLSNEFEDEREWRKKDDFNSPHPKNWLMRSLALRQFYHLKTEKINGQLLPLAVRVLSSPNDAKTEALASADESNQKRWAELVEKVTLQSVQRVKDAGIPLLLITQATREALDDGSVILNDSKLASMTASLSGDHTASVSMKEAISSDQAASLYRDSWHVQTEGHRLIAKTILEKLRQLNWLPQTHLSR